MEQNLSSYEDKLQFYLVYSSDKNKLSSEMLYARKVTISKLYFSIHSVSLKQKRNMLTMAYF